MIRKQKLEPTWVGNENRSKREPRNLPEDPSMKYYPGRRIASADYRRLIQWLAW